ncbi:nitrite/sulfite reductase [Sporolituus thermophilus]|uniref:Ferredoxin-nitrite reductase n=1 Tax=Sporolituus thermophilus DSM 23256 TaxID=1123285 RepID=A0A1G7JZ60_9FIRM|nr:ferredoxin--nitrite reductase [Sporolituus thermophilus]SDF30190.1 ferredoxin-nitrite reductase [Sporolituus thermophilus DSM 23256]
MERPWAKDLAKLNKTELIKLKKDGLAILDDIERLAAAGFAALGAEDIELLKWAGLYGQKPRTDGYFMLRVKVPGGIMNGEQVRTLAAIARAYGRNELHLTTRQAVQFYWIRLEYLPDIFARLAAAGLSSVESAGDCPRAVTGNPLAGIDPDEVIDTKPLVEAVTRFFQGNPEFSNLPRKFKISISSSGLNPGHAEINDVAFTPAVKEIDGEQVIGFHVMVGGGLAAKPHMAVKLDIFVRPEEVVKVAAAVATIFRDFGYREHRFHARLKYLVADWGEARFRSELLKLTGPLPTRGQDLTRGWNGGYYYGVHPQKQAGLHYVGLAIPGGLLTAADLEGLAELAVRYGDGSLRTTNTQNLILANVAADKVTALLDEALVKRFTPFPQPFAGHTVACTGNTFCTMAIVETKRRLNSIAEYLDKHVELDTPVRLHMSGCPNACGHHQIADIGLQGSLLNVDGKAIEAFELWLGGALGPGAAFATKLEGRIPADDAAKAIERLLKFFQANKGEGETFAAFVRRVGVPAFQTKLDEFLGVSGHGEQPVKKAVNG